MYRLFSMKFQKAKCKIYARAPYFVVVIDLFNLFDLFA